MSCLRYWRSILWVPALAVIVAGLACTGTKTQKSGNGDDDPKGDPSAELKPVEAKSYKATIKGKVVYDSTVPERADLSKTFEKFEENKDKNECLKGNMMDPTWIVDGKNGVANVFVWLEPEANHFFKLDDKIHLDSKTGGWDENVVIKQPHCAFEPHAVVLFPSYTDPANPKKTKNTTQKLVVENNASFQHNTKWKGGKLNDGDNINLDAGKKLTEPQLKIKAGDNTPVVFTCTIHGWMNAVARAFHHPFAVVTQPDGTFEIKNVPVGAKVRVVAWHESDVYGDGGKKGKEIEIKEGDNNLGEIKVKKE